MMDVEALKATAKLRVRGQGYDSFHIGQELTHHWGRTVTEADTVQFSYLTLSYNPLYFNAEYARAHGHPSIVVNPHLVFNIVLGLTVEDCSEGIGGPFLGVDELKYHEPVYPGDTLTAHSVTIGKRLSKGNAARGIVTWHSRGLNQHGRCVVEFKRSNLADPEHAAAIREA